MAALQEINKNLNFSMRFESFVEPDAGSWCARRRARAFVPAPLPPAIEYSPRLVKRLSAADAALGELSGLGRKMPNPHLLIAPYLRQEAVLSSRIEAHRPAYRICFRMSCRTRAMRRPPANSRGNAIGATMRRKCATMCWRWSTRLRRLPTLPVSLRLVRELHAQLMSACVAVTKPGEFRQHQNYIGVQGSRIDTASFIAAPPDRMLAASTRGALPASRCAGPIDCALMHAQFETIHPFADGNGRVGRLLITLLLVERERLVAAHCCICRRTSRPTSKILRTAAANADAWRLGWLGWSTSCWAWKSRHEWLQQVTALNDLRDVWHARFVGQAGDQIGCVVCEPADGRQARAQVTGRSDPSARQAIATLEAAGILREITGRSWGKVYSAHEVLVLCSNRIRICADRWRFQPGCGGPLFVMAFSA